ncbi:epsin TDEL_0C02050 [Torulaspora delbrueckii]|uniref:ENTH domain-containing protein n=1 Tax=Torulaspora delbrueckii TaxID=4950 RepID=G8ZRF2_TORDE|nr:hypothetical protein TDEL_0C02050 [Torulaspora delbrueckii]CCE91094.1 hypothetical protein TDEL_0C02050 [Torulaspora delbrueckii]
MSKQFVRSAKNVVKGYSSAQVLVRNATANESEGPSVDELDELAEKTYDSVEFFEIMDMIDKRLNDKGKYWRHIAKSLTVLDYLVRFGSENCVLWCRENLYVIKTLMEFRNDDDGGVDQGQIIRVKAKELTNLLSDDERLREEREMNRKGRKNGTRRRRRTTGEQDGFDDDLQRALDESRLTAEEDERRRKMLGSEDDDLQAALQLSKEEEELKRLQEMQKLQQQQTQQQPSQYYDIFGNPISPEEYFQYQQQQDLLAQQQREQELLAQQQEQQRLAEQQYWAMQQEALAQQQALAEQQALAQQQAALQQNQWYQQQQASGYYQQPMATGSNNPFALNNLQLQQARPAQSSPVPNFTSTQAQSPPKPQPQAQPQKQAPLPQQPQQALKPVRTGDLAMTEKYGELNKLLATGTGIDTFGNTGDARIPAQHTKTGTFINSQGTGYRQVTGEPKKNPFLQSQYTGIPSSNIVPAHTGYGFGNQPSQQNQAQQHQTADQGVSLIDL